jgi:cell division protein FtsB
LKRFSGWSSHGVKRTGWNIDLRTALSGLALVGGVALFAAFYLALASQTAMLGRRLQEMEATRMAIVRENAHLRNQIAHAASAVESRRRALAAGFITTGTVIFVEVPAVESNELLNVGHESSPP